MIHTQGSFPATRNLQLYYQSWQPAHESKGVVVAVHGHGDHSGGLRNAIFHLVESGYSWYGFDLRGHGRSPGVRGHIQNWSDFQSDLDRFLHKVKETENEKAIYLLGHSLGGLISIEYALKKPEGLAGLIAISPALGYSRVSPLKTRVLRAFGYLRPDFTLKTQTDYAQLTRDAQVADVLAADPLRHEHMSLKLWRELDNCRHWVRSHAVDLSVPLLMIYGLDDSITPAAANQQFLRESALAEREHHKYGQTRHRPFDDVNRAEVLEHITDWLERQQVAAQPVYAPST